MRFSPLSFVIGIAAASLVPVISRVFRPFAVEATAAGLGMIEDARRIVAEQLETLEDIRHFTNPTLEVAGLIPTLFDGRTRHAQEVLADVETRRGRHRVAGSHGRGRGRRAGRSRPRAAADERRRPAPLVVIVAR